MNDYLCSLDISQVLVARFEFDFDFLYGKRAIHSLTAKLVLVPQI
jgi:hypothetical protein